MWKFLKKLRNLKYKQIINDIEKNFQNYNYEFFSMTQIYTIDVYTIYKVILQYRNYIDEENAYIVSLEKILNEHERERTVLETYTIKNFDDALICFNNLVLKCQTYSKQ